MPRTLSDDDPRHGTENGYGRYRCRCERCRKAHADYLREWKHRNGYCRPYDQYLAEVRATALAQDNHGTETRYGLGCRCADCRTAAADSRRRRRAARR